MIILFIASILIGFSIGMLGVGGVFLAPVLILIMSLPMSTAVGTALSTFIGTGILGSYIYHKNGNIDWSSAMILGSLSVFGAILGSKLNLSLPQEKLKIGLAIFLILIGIFTIIKESLNMTEANRSLNLTALWEKIILSIIGICVGIVSGLLGVGGPVLLVPILVNLGWPMLKAVGVSQVVSVFAATVGTVNYLLSGRIEVSLSILVLSGELIGVISGGYLAHKINGERLKCLLGGMLISLGIYFC